MNAYVVLQTGTGTRHVNDTASPKDDTLCGKPLRDTWRQITQEATGDEQQVLDVDGLCASCERSLTRRLGFKESGS